MKYPWYDRVVLRCDRWIHISLRLIEHPVDTIAGKVGSLTRMQRLALSLAFGIGAGFFALLELVRPGQLLEGLAWSQYTGIVVVFGCTFGTILLALARWWFEVRLWLASVSPIPAGTAFDTHLLPSVFWILPAIGGGFLMSLYFESPGAVLTSERGWAPVALFALLGLWSEVVFLLTVRRVFRVSALSLTLAFVLLPAVVLWCLRIAANLLRSAGT